MKTILAFILTIFIQIFGWTPTFAAEKSLPAASNPRTVLLVIIDGLTVGAIEKFPLTSLQNLKTEGCYYKQVYLPLAAHPQPANYDLNAPDYYPWTCSIPNVVMMSGSIFVGTPGLKQALLQYSYRAVGKTSAFLVNDESYDEIAGGYDQYLHDWSNEDDAPVFPRLKEILEKDSPYFVRVHLQSTGAGGYIDQAARRTIWDENSAYRQRAVKADKLIGDFIGWLKSTHQWSDMVLFVCGDHGEADRGGHAPYDLYGDCTSLIIAGKGVKVGQVFEYAEMIDIAPTIAHLQQTPLPKFSQGRVLIEAFVGNAATIPSERYLLRLNVALRDHHELISQNKSLLQDENFVHENEKFLVIERIGSWRNQFNNLKILTEHQEATLKKLQDIAKISLK